MPQKTALFIESQYAPCIEYFSLINKSDVIVIDDLEKFKKQSYRNRCKIKLANKVETLSIPILKESKGKAFNELQIDYTQRWLKNHIRGIQSGYGKSPFFEHYWPELEAILSEKHKLLFGLNQQILTFCLKHLGLKKEIILSSDKNYQADNYVLNNYKDLIHPKKNNLTKNHQSYYQVFGNDFVDNLSVIDLLFCEGPLSSQYLKHQ